MVLLISTSFAAFLSNNGTRYATIVLSRVKISDIQLETMLSCTSDDLFCKMKRLQ